MSDHKPKKSTQGPAVTSQLERAFGVLGLVLVLSAVSYLVWDWFTGSNAPPEILLEVERMVPSSGGFVVEFSANNQGGVAALSIEIEGTLSEHDVIREHSSVTLEDVPSHSTRRGGLYFQRNPAELDLRLRPLGYRKP